MKTINGYKISLKSSGKGDDIKKLLLDNRGIKTKDEYKYFECSIDDLIDPYLFEGIDKAVSRIKDAIDKKERIIIFGDYDVDGVSSTAMLYKFFKEKGAEISYRIPHRSEDGYGLKDYFIEDINKTGAKLIVTVDCGTRDTREIALANKLGIDVIITDHHNVPEKLSKETTAIINPKLPNSNYPNKNLSGSGVAFKLLHGYEQKINPKGFKKTLLRYIDFAMLGTISDCMELKGENRVIAKLGLIQLQNTDSKGLKEIIKGDNITKSDSDIVGYKIGPILNAAGRMDSAYKALKVLLVGEDNLEKVIKEIETLNENRKKETEKFYQDALKKIDSNKSVILYKSSKVGHGIIGLIASKLSDKYNKIAICLTEEEDKLVGSARGPEGYKIVDILDKMNDLFELYGGHDQAAGFTINKNNYTKFEKIIQKEVVKISDNLNKEKEILIDGNLNINKIDFPLLDFIEKMKPFGIGNEKPLFISNELKFDNVKFIGKENKHLKLNINGVGLDFVAFGYGEFYNKIIRSNKVRILYELERNIWNNKESISLMIKDFIIM